MGETYTVDYPDSVFYNNPPNQHEYTYIVYLKEFPRKPIVTKYLGAKNPEDTDQWVIESPGGEQNS